MSETATSPRVVGIYHGEEGEPMQPVQWIEVRCPPDMAKVAHSASPTTQPDSEPAPNSELLLIASETITDAIPPIPADYCVFTEGISPQDLLDVRFRLGSVSVQGAALWLPEVGLAASATTDHLAIVPRGAQGLWAQILDSGIITMSSPIGGSPLLKEWIVYEEPLPRDPEAEAGDY